VPILVLTFFVGVVVGVLARYRTWSALAAIPLSYVVAWCSLVLVAVIGTAVDDRPNRGLLGNVLFVGLIGIWSALPACVGCALALVGRHPPAANSQSIDDERH
jgi:hypothetical protein